MADEDTEDRGPRQRVSRLPPDTETGPLFPSGMSAPEAAMAGAVADMTDEDREKVAEQAEEYGLPEAPDQPERQEPEGAVEVEQTTDSP